MGYSYDPEALKKVAATNSAAAAAIDTGLSCERPPIDAGASSEIVGLAVTNLVAIGITLAKTFEEIGTRVDTTRGSYAEVENNNAGEMRFMERYHMMHGVTAYNGPLADAPGRTTVAQP